MIDNMLIRAGLEAHSAAGTRGGSQARSWWELQRCDTRTAQVGSRGARPDETHTREAAGGVGG